MWHGGIGRDDHEYLLDRAGRFQCTPVRVDVVVALFGVALARDSLHLEEEFSRVWRERQMTLSLHFGRLFIVRCRRRLRTPLGMINLGGLNEMSQLGC